MRALALLGAVARALPDVRARHAAPQRDGPPRRVLVIRPDHLGDLLLATPALRLLRSRWAEAHVTALVGPWAAEVARRSPHVDAVAPCDFPWFNRRANRYRAEPYVRLLRTAVVLRRGRYDLALSLRFDFWWGAALAALAGIPRVVGYDWPTCRPFLSDAVPWRDGWHAVVQNVRLVASATDAPDDAVTAAASWPLEFRVSPAEQRFAARLLPQEGRWVALHPGSGAVVKLWPGEHWHWLAERLVRDGCRLVWTGSGPERGLCASLARSVGGVLAAGATTVGQLAALYARCALVLGPDSGPLHLAAAVGTPTVRLFGPADPAQFGPPERDKRHVVVLSSWPCAPCGRLDYSPHALPYHRCMAGVLPARVLAAARQALATVPSRHDATASQA